VTLGRVRSPKGLARVLAALARDAERDFGRWTATDVVLYQSRLRPTGAVYTPVATLPLAGTGAAEGG
jgi:2'-5' RNA ligase